MSFKRDTRKDMVYVVLIHLLCKPGRGCVCFSVMSCVFSFKVHINLYYIAAS